MGMLSSDNHRTRPPPPPPPVSLGFRYRAISQQGEGSGWEGVKRDDQVSKGER